MKTAVPCTRFEQGRSCVLDVHKPAPHKAGKTYTFTEQAMSVVLLVERRRLVKSLAIRSASSHAILWYHHGKNALGLAL